MMGVFIFEFRRPYPACPVNDIGHKYRFRVSDPNHRPLTIRYTRIPISIITRYEVSEMRRLIVV